MAGNLNAESAEQHLGDRSAGYAGCGLSCGGTLQDVASILEVVFERSGEVGVAGTRAGHGFVLLRVASFDREDLLPVLPIAVGERHRDGRADGVAVADTGEDVGGVAVD